MAPWSAGARPGTVSPSSVSSISIGVTPIQCFCWIRSLVALSESAYCLFTASHHCGSKRARSWSARPPAQRSVDAVALGLRHVREVIETADEVDGVVELLRTHVRAFDVAQALRPAVVIGVERRHDVLEVADREVIQRVAEAVVARPAPQQRDRARELRRLVRVAGARVGAVVDRAVGDDLVRDLARALVRGIADVAQRDQVRLGRLELPERDRREGGVLAVGGEQPRVVRIARAEERDLRDLRDRRRIRLLALVDEAQVQIGRRLREIGEVLLAPVDRLLQRPVAGQVELGVLAELAHASRPSRPAGGRGRAARRRGPAWSPRPRSTPSRSGRLDRDLVPQLPAGALAEWAVVATARRRRGVGRGADRAGLRAPVAGAGLGAVGAPVGRPRTR